MVESPHVGYFSFDSDTFDVKISKYGTYALIDGIQATGERGNYSTEGRAVGRTFFFPCARVLIYPQSQPREKILPPGTTHLTDKLHFLANVLNIPIS